MMEVLLLVNNEYAWIYLVGVPRCFLPLISHLSPLKKMGSMPSGFHPPSLTCKQNHHLRNYPMTYYYIMMLYPFFCVLSRVYMILSMILSPNPHTPFRPRWVVRKTVVRPSKHVPSKYELQNMFSMCC